MPKRIYVGNLPPGTKERELKQLFASYGEIKSVIIYDPTGKQANGRRTFTIDQGSEPGCYAHIIMSDDIAVTIALRNLHQKTLGGNTLHIKAI